eukprot:Trichotokara_eunicae@DN1942_c0_g1_i1.p1
MPPRSNYEYLRNNTDPRIQKLVSAFDLANKRPGALSSDIAEAQILSTKVQEGDVVVLATDGFWDNVLDGEIQAVLGLCLSPYESKLVRGHPYRATSAHNISKALALMAYYRSHQAKCTTPYQKSARKNNVIIQAGKRDDIAVTVAWVVAKESPEL